MSHQPRKVIGTASTPHSATESTTPQPLEGFLQEAIDDVQSGRVVASDIKTNGRLSRRAIKAWAARRKLPFAWNSLLGNPKLYPLWRTLKFAVEGITLSKAEVAICHALLIAALRIHLSRWPAATTSSKLFLTDAQGRDLYKQVTALPHAPFIWQLAGLDQGRSNYDYWSDQELVDSGARFDTFTALKEGDDALHRVLKGRGLCRRVMQANPAMVNHFYIAISGDVCRSLAELVASNYLTLRGVRHDWEPRLDVCRPGSQRSMLADAHLHECDLYLECAQNLAYDRGQRRKTYSIRMAQKVRLCTAAGLNMVVVDGDRYTVRGVLDVVRFAQHLHDKLLASGQDIGPPPPATELMRSRHHALRARLIQGDRATVMASLAELGIDGIAKLQNHHAHIHTCLKVRDDYQAIMDDIKAASNFRRWGSLNKRRPKGSTRRH